MKKQLVRQCKYASSTWNDSPLYCDVYLLVQDAGNPLWHENVFLCELAKTESTNTVRSYASDLLSFCRMAVPYGGWRGISKNIMLGYIRGELFQKRNYSPTTLLRHVETLKKFYEWLYSKGYLYTLPNFEWSIKNLFVQKFKDKGAYLANQHSFHSLYLSNEEFECVLAGIKSKNKFIERRNEIILRLGYECGLRAHEVLNLDTDDVFKHISVNREKNCGLWATSQVAIKGKGNKLRDIYIPPNLCELIYYYINNYRRKLKFNHGALICNVKGVRPKDPKLASNIFSEACKSSKISRHHHQGYHRLRKSFGTNLVNNCNLQGRDPWVEVPRRLGHNDLRTTKSYIQFDALLHKRSEVLTALSMCDERFDGLTRIRKLLDD